MAANCCLSLTRMAKRTKEINKLVASTLCLSVTRVLSVVEGLKQIESRLQYSENNYLFRGSDSSHDLLVGLT